MGGGRGVEETKDITRNQRRYYKQKCEKNILVAVAYLEQWLEKWSEVAKILYAPATRWL